MNQFVKLTVAFMFYSVLFISCGDGNVEDLDDVIKNDEDVIEDVFELILNERNMKDIDLVLGAKGSPLQLILANVYHIDAPTGNISLSEAEKVMRNPYIESGIPLAYGDNYRGYRIVGSNHTYPEHYGVEIAKGKLWKDDFEVTLGARIAEETGLEIGDTFYSSHGLKDSTNVHDDKAFTVVGILSRSETVIDKLILTGLESIWSVHATIDENLTSQELYESREITAVLLKRRNTMAIVTLPKLLRETNMQVVIPAIEINRLNKLLTFFCRNSKCICNSGGYDVEIGE